MCARAQVEMSVCDDERSGCELADVSKTQVARIQSCTATSVSPIPLIHHVFTHPSTHTYAFARGESTHAHAHVHTHEDACTCAHACVCRTRLALMPAFTMVYTCHGFEGTVVLQARWSCRHGGLAGTVVLQARWSCRHGGFAGTVVVCGHCGLHCTRDYHRCRPRCCC